GFATVAGITLGLAVVGLAASLGLAEIVTQSPGLYAALRWAGIVFLLYLAVDAWRDSSTEVGPVAEPASKHFARGLMTNLLNPKAAVFYIAVLPTFLDDVSPTLSQTLLLTTIYLLVATAIHCAIVILAGSLGAVLNEPSRERFIRRFLAIVLAIVAVWFAWTTRR
ncbi:MAG: LysE family translocator, partial [Phyllobacterium sp.]|nr:LysE family translocator [Phyllobacterium sp.]